MFIVQPTGDKKLYSVKYLHFMEVTLIFATCTILKKKQVHLPLSL